MAIHALKPEDVRRKKTRTEDRKILLALPPQPHYPKTHDVPLVRPIRTYSEKAGNGIGSVRSSRHRDSSRDGGRELKDSDSLENFRPRPRKRTGPLFFLAIQQAVLDNIQGPQRKLLRITKTRSHVTVGREWGGGYEHKIQQYHK